MMKGSRSRLLVGLIAFASSQSDPCRFSFTVRGKQVWVETAVFDSRAASHVVRSVGVAALLGAFACDGEGCVVGRLLAAANASGCLARAATCVERAARADAAADVCAYHPRIEE